MLFYICESHICIYKKSTRLFTVVEPVQIDNRQNIRIGFVMACILPANASACLSPQGEFAHKHERIRHMHGIEYYTSFSIVDSEPD